MLRIKEIFSTMQGEGSQSGTPSVFVRLVGCNLWSGRESGRASAVGDCGQWCDTDFVDGSKMSTDQIVDQVLALTSEWSCPHVTITGGEPCLQLKRAKGEEFVEALLSEGVSVAVETNGTVFAGILDHPSVHVTVSPKKKVKSPGSLDHIVVRRGTDLKVVWPQWEDRLMLQMRNWNFDHYYIQPLDSGNIVESSNRAIAQCAKLGFKLSVQTHKFLGVP